MAAEDPMASFLRDARKAPSKKCHVCNDEKAREYLLRLCELKEKDDPSVTGMNVARFREEFLAGQLGLTVSTHSCIRHIKECLKRDVTTGRPRISS